MSLPSAAVAEADPDLLRVALTDADPKLLEVALTKVNIYTISTPYLYLSVWVRLICCPVLPATSTLTTLPGLPWLMYRLLIPPTEKYHKSSAMMKI